MKKNYRSSLERGLLSIILYFFNFIFYGYLISLLFDSSDFYNFLVRNWLPIIATLGVSIFLYLGKTNNDFILTNDSLSVKSRVPLFKKEKSFPLIKIKKVIISSEWSENILKNQFGETFRFIIVNFVLTFFFPHSYKWVKITDIEGKSYQYYCFGLEFDYHDNYEEIRVEHLFEDLKLKGIEVSWSNPNDDYYN